MKQLYALSQEGEGELLRRLGNCDGVQAARDEALKHLDRIGAQYLAQPLDAAARQKAMGLLAVARAALETLGAVNGAQVLRLPGAAQPGYGWRQRIKCLPPLLGAAAALWALLTSQTLLGLMCLACALGGFLALRDGGARPDRELIEARPRVDAQALARRIGYLAREMDALLQDDGCAPEDAPLLTAPMLESVQMLMEAQLTGDAQYALKGVSPLADALARQGIEFVTYAPDRAQDFDLLPAPTGGQTIRPALRQGETLLLRGQATVKR